MGRKDLFSRRMTSVAVYLNDAAIKWSIELTVEWGKYGSHDIFTIRFPKDGDQIEYHTNCFSSTWFNGDWRDFEKIVVSKIGRLQK